MEAEVTEILAPEKLFEEAGIDLMKSYSSSGLKWIILDYSSFWRAGLSWSIFFLLNIFVPIVAHFVYSCSVCDPDHRRPFVSISSFARGYYLRRFLFLDKLCDESEKVRQEYALQIHRSMKLLSAFVLPCFVADSAYKIWWFAWGGNQIPYPYNVYLSKAVVCLLLMSSWLYRVSICFLVCILFRLTCYLQILRLEEFAQVFEKESDVASILIEQLRIRRNLRVISHRFRLFMPRKLSPSCENMNLKNVRCMY